MNLLQRFTKRKPRFVTVVSGLPRSGTSLMMKMLEAGGIEPLQDGVRTADVDNPKGYYEFERAKGLSKGDKAWVADAAGKSVKVISALLMHLPTEYEYRILFMRRQIDEIVASQKKMLVHREEEEVADDAEIRRLLQQHVNLVRGWLDRQPTFHVLDVDYNQLMQTPQVQIPQINQFLDGRLDTNAMAHVIDPALYRNRER